MVICVVATYHIYGCTCDISAMLYVCVILSLKKSNFMGYVPGDVLGSLQPTMDDKLPWNMTHFV